MEVDFIVVDSYSPYTAIVAKPSLHALGAVSSTLHQKVKYSSEGLVKEILGNQSNGGHLAQTRGCIIGLCWKAPIAIKGFDFIKGKVSREGELRRFGESDHWYWSGNFFSSWGTTASSWKIGTSWIPSRECWCICLGRLRSPRNWSWLYLPSPECQPINRS